MILTVTQTKKELFSAEFDIISNQQTIGHASFSGPADVYKHKWQITFNGQVYFLNRVIEGSRLSDDELWAYEIIHNGNRNGKVFQTREKTGFISAYVYHKMLFNDSEYSIYPIGFGKDGNRCPIYNGDVQIAQVEKDCIVKEDLHTFKLYSISEESALLAIIFSSFMYSIHYFACGRKVVNSTQKLIEITKNKKLLEKYDPSFKSNNFIV